jgi:hypothetical protein
MRKKIFGLTQSSAFTNFILVAIVVNTIVIGIQASHSVNKYYGRIPNIVSIPWIFIYYLNVIIGWYLEVIDACLIGKPTKQKPSIKLRMIKT